MSTGLFIRRPTSERVKNVCEVDGGSGLRLSHPRRLP